MVIAPPNRGCPGYPICTEIESEPKKDRGAPMAERLRRNGLLGPAIGRVVIPGAGEFA
jgi:hypothetical protein